VELGKPNVDYGLFLLNVAQRQAEQFTAPQPATEKKNKADPNRPGA
jgi:hypothetical protein